MGFVAINLSSNKSRVKHKTEKTPLTCMSHARMIHERVLRMRYCVGGLDQNP